MSPPYEPVDPGQSLPDLEQGILERWRERDVFHESVRRREGAEPYLFYEGPPTANGRPGSHHVLSRVFKDVFPRYRTMRGRLVHRKGGWDCHGLPVELEIERQMGMKSKEDIERFGIAEFNAKCRESVLTYVDEWNRLTERIGFWIDTDQAYKTMDNTYIESVWWALKEVWKKGLLYQGHKVVPYCARCGTALSSHEVAQGYKDVVDPSVYVRFPVEPGVSLLGWTTTPWTLVSNAALAVGEDIDYVYARLGDETLIVAEALVEKVLGDGVVIEKKVKGRDLVGLKYEPPFPFISDYGPNGHTVLPADFVTTEDGTGVVHTAVAFGEDDYRLGEQQGLTVHNPVKLDGTFDERITPWAGMWVKDADPLIVEAFGRQALPGGRLRALVPALLALRHAAPLLRQGELVREDDRRARPDARQQRGHHLVPGPHQARALRQVAGEQRRLGAVARALLGHAAAGLAVRQRARPRDRVGRGAAHARG